ncbi:hypothetical protein GGR54DRAFT_637112 [Hypoxylon sp. NC1633]|nr:hypothetical protein GGR54DRAFT_637112 [Hypoxylon sp. NC1633]
MVRNDSDTPTTLRHNQVLGHLMSIDPTCSAWQVEADNAQTAAEFAAKRPPKSKEAPRPTVIKANDPTTSFKHHTGVTIYKDPNVLTDHSATKNIVAQTTLKVIGLIGRAEGTDEYLRKKGISTIVAPSGPHQSCGLVEVFNRIFQSVLKKTTNPRPADVQVDSIDWVSSLSDVMTQVNARYIESLGHSPFEILYGSLPVGAFKQSFPPTQLSTLMTALKDPEFLPPTGERLTDLIVDHLARQEWCREEIAEMAQAEHRHRAEVHSLRSSKIRENDLVMLIQEGRAPSQTALSMLPVGTEYCMELTFDGHLRTYAMAQSRGMEWNED